MQNYIIKFFVHFVFWLFVSAIKFPRIKIELINFWPILFKSFHRLSTHCTGSIYLRKMSESQCLDPSCCSLWRWSYIGRLEKFAFCGILRVLSHSLRSMLHSQLWRGQCTDTHEWHLEQFHSETRSRDAWLDCLQPFVSSCIRQCPWARRFVCIVAIRTFWNELQRWPEIDIKYKMIKLFSFQVSTKIHTRKLRRGCFKIPDIVAMLSVLESCLHLHVRFLTNIPEVVQYILVPFMYWKKNKVYLSD